MVAALVLITFLVCITIDVVRRHRRRIPAVSHLPEPPTAEVRERYFYPGHSWALVENSRVVTVGVDDLVPRVIGKLDKIEIAKTGATVRQGEPLVTLHSGSRSLSLGSPVSGIVEEINLSLSDHPSLLADSPLEKGWIAKLAPRNLSSEIRDLLNGSAARQWHEAVQIQVASWFSPRLGTVLQDGGQWIDSVSSLLTDEQWKELTQALFFTGPFKRSKI
jgi:glycine cleavage system H protein